MTGIVEDRDEHQGEDDEGVATGEMKFSSKEC